MSGCHPESEPTSCVFRSKRNRVPHVQGGVRVTRQFDGEPVPSSRCAGCGYLFFDAPSGAVLEQFYNETYPRSAAGWYNPEADYSPWKAKPRAERIARIAGRFGHSKSGFHEIGCAYGGTVFELSRMGYETSGSDLNGTAVEIGAARGARLYQGDLSPDFFAEGGKPGVLYSYHMIEHVPDPVQFLRRLAGVIHENGIAIFISPNALTPFPLVHNFRNYPWYGYPEHLHLFSPASIRCLARAAGFDLLHIASAPFQVIPYENDRVLHAIDQSPVASTIRDYVLSRAMLQEELEFVLTPAGSLTALRYADDIHDAAVACEASRPFETMISVASEAAPSVDPWH